ncbi:MAG: DUF2817 domain-containing protein [Gammaproteobacteria bacterium]|jgi:hypothetical protein|nr:DUF2817 domain-containing protein [Gammaproteobacteria bacterium]
MNIKERAPVAREFTRYSSARSRFLEAAQRLGASFESYENPMGDREEPLVTDVAVFGEDNAERALLVISGTHGLEGPAGSAAQSAWLENRNSTGLPSGIRLVFIHALNPWGFARMSRTTEDNIDLNRNFVDFERSLPGNERYPEIHAIACPEHYDEKVVERITEGLKAYAEQHGYEALTNGLGGGQYTHADGLHYGGRGKAWSRKVLEEVIERHLAGVPRVGVIDWHTGRGDYAEPFFLCFSSPGSETYRLAIDWWGEEAILRKDEIGAAYEGEAPPPRSGLLFSGIEAALGEESDTVGAVIEFGTYEPERVIRAELIDRFLKFGTVDESLRPQLRATMIEAFCPNDARWRSAVEAHGLEITEQAVEGLKRWP